MLSPKRAAKLVPTALVAAALGIAGCGKPQYCSDVGNLKKSVDDLSGVELERGSLPTLRTELQQVRGDAQAAVSAAKQDFPTETRALESSLASASAAIGALPASPTREQLLGAGGELRGVANAARDLSGATQSACG
jgi:hypothetical protein